MKTVEQILKTKSQHQTVYTIGPDDSVLDALKMLAEKRRCAPGGRGQPGGGYRQ